MAARVLPIVLLLAAVVLLPASTAAGPQPTEPPPLAGSASQPVAAPSGPESIGLHPEVRISMARHMEETDRYAPAVAENFVHKEYLVLWHNEWPSGHRDIYARRATLDGRLLSWFAITTGPHDRLQPAAAYGLANGEYLVVWMYDVHGDGSQYEIWGRFVAWDGSQMKPEFKIISWPGRTFTSPRVAYNNNRNQFLVVWNAAETGSLVPTDISSMLLGADGTIITGRNLTTSTYPHQADVAYNWYTNEYFVVFVRTYTAATTGNDIFGLRVTAENAVVPGGMVTVHAGEKHQNAPRVAVAGDTDMVVVFEHENHAADGDIYFRRFNRNGVPIGTSYALTLRPEDERRPDVAAGYVATRFMAVWERIESNGTMIAARAWGDGLPPRSFDVAGGVTWETVAPAIAANPPRYFVAYEGDSQGNPTIIRHIYGRQWTRPTVFLPLTPRR